MKKQAGLNVQKENIQSKHGLVCVRSSRQKKKTNLRESQMTIWTVLDFSCLELNEKIDTLLWKEALMTHPTGDPVVYVIMWAPWSRFPPVCSTKWDLLCRGVLWELVKAMCVQHWLKFSTERKKKQNLLVKWFRAGMSNSFSIVGHIQRNIFLSVWRSLTTHLKSKSVFPHDKVFLL